MVFADGKSGARHRFNVDHLRLRGGQGPLAVDFALTADGRPVDLAGTLPPLAALGQPGSALPVKLAGTVDGQPLSLDGVLKLSQGAAGAFDAVTVPRLAASYGGLDLSGKMAVDLVGKRPAIDVDLTVSAVDLHALPGVGWPPMMALRVGLLAGLRVRRAQVLRQRIRLTNPYRWPPLAMSTAN